MLVSLASALLVIASAGFGMLFAWQVGSKHDAVLGALSVAMALGLEISKPFAISNAFASLRQWRVMTAAALTLVGALAVGYSLQAELMFISMTRGDLVAERAGDRDAAMRAEERYRRAEADIAALKPAGTSKCATAAYLERRDALQNEMHQAEQDHRAVPIVAYADPGAVALSAYVGALGVKADPQQLGLWLPLVGVLALEIGAAFSVVLVRSVVAVPRDIQMPVSTGDAVSQEPSADVSSGTPAKRPKAKRRDREPPSKGRQGAMGQGVA
jgi:hypothetical protein